MTARSWLRTSSAPSLHRRVGMFSTLCPYFIDSEFRSLLKIVLDPCPQLWHRLQEFVVSKKRRFFEYDHIHFVLSQRSENGPIHFGKIRRAEAVARQDEKPWLR